MRYATRLPFPDAHLQGIAITLAYASGEPVDGSVAALNILNDMKVAAIDKHKPDGEPA